MLLMGSGILVGKRGHSRTLCRWGGAEWGIGFGYDFRKIAESLRLVDQSAGTRDTGIY